MLLQWLATITIGGAAGGPTVGAVPQPAGGFTVDDPAVQALASTVQQAPGTVAEAGNIFGYLPSPAQLLAWLRGGGQGTPITPPALPPAGGAPEAPPAPAPTSGNPAVSGIIGAIEQTAQKYGLDPLLALATAIHESGLNPQAQGDYSNGVPTSFGLFQLHQGGELGNLTPGQAFDPYTNADVALSTMADFARHGQYQTPGQLAAAAQRPADPVGYAYAIDSLYRQLQAGTLPLG